MGSGLVSADAARSIGLERMWFTHLSLDRSRGRVAGVHLHVSSTDVRTVFEVSHGGNRYLFSQHDRNAFGEELGVEGARQRAQERAAELQAEQQAAGKKDVSPPVVKTHVIPAMTLYATSERGSVHAIDAETGRTRWTTSVGNPNYPTTAPAANDKLVGVCNGSTLYILNALDGSPVWSHVCAGAPGAGPALSQELVFVPMFGGQVETLYLDNPRRTATIFKSFGRATVQPVVSFNSVAWPTDEGRLYVGLGHTPGMRYRVEAKDAIDAAPAFLRPDKLFATSRDGYLYCIDERRGSVLWRFTTGEPISHSPVALGNQVYAITEAGNMFAVDVATGSELWTATGVRAFLAGNEKRIYLLTLRGNLLAMDAGSGSRLGEIPAPQIDLPFLNTKSDRVFLITRRGLVQCLRESDAVFPLLHYWEQAQETPKLKKGPVKKAGETENATPEAAPPPATDPFSAPPGGSAPAGGAAPPAADPFGPAPAAPAAPGAAAPGGAAPAAEADPFAPK